LSQLISRTAFFEPLRFCFSAIERIWGVKVAFALGTALMAERLQAREHEREEDDEACEEMGDCVPEPWRIYNGLTPTLQLLGFLGNCTPRAAFAPEISAHVPRPLIGSTRSTTKATSYTGRQVELNATVLLHGYLWEFQARFFLDPATRFLLNLPAVSGTTWVHVI
jgi:hypothetical protein